MKPGYIIGVFSLLAILFGCDGSGGGSSGDTALVTQEPTDPNPTDPNPSDPNRKNSYLLSSLKGISNVWLNKKGEYAGTKNSAAWLVTAAENKMIGHCCDSWVAGLTGSADVIGNTYSDQSLHEPDLERIRWKTSRSTWLYQNDVTESLGLDVLTGNISANFHRSYALNENGSVAGASAYIPDRCLANKDVFTDNFFQCDDGEETLYAAWKYRDGSYQTIGLEDTQGVSSENIPAAINEAGDVAGTSGDVCWLYSMGVTVVIAPSENDASPISELEASCHIKQLNEAGQVIGDIENSHTENRVSYYAWLLSEGTTRIVGLYDDEHVDKNGRTNNRAIIMSETGHVAGQAWRSSPVSVHSVWLHTGGKTIDISLKDSEHTNDNGSIRSELVGLNDLGHVAGYSVRYGDAVSNDTHLFGNTAWLYNGGEHILLGNRDDNHIDTDGTRDSKPSAMGQSGDVAGYSKRFPAIDGPYPCFSLCNSQSAWFYDYNRDKLYPIQLSERSDGFTYSEVIGIRDDGVLVGYFMDFDENDEFEWNVFTFSVKKGLEIALVDGLDPDTVRSFPTNFNGAGYFIGANQLFSPVLE